MRGTLGGWYLGVGRGAEWRSQQLQYQLQAGSSVVATGAVLLGHVRHEARRLHVLLNRRGEVEDTDLGLVLVEVK